MLAFLLCWAVVLVAVMWDRFPVSPARRVWIFPSVGLILLGLFWQVDAGLRLLASSLLLLYMFKGSAAALCRTPVSTFGRTLYWSIWPGMDLESFAKKQTAAQTSGGRFVRGLLSVYLGTALLLVAIFAPIGEVFRTWIGLAAILTLIHFGIANLLTAALQMLGFPVKPLFERPLESQSLNDFWTRRWNLAFVEMNRRIFMPILSRKLGLKWAIFATFLISGILHELAISYPAGAGWGGPFTYFLLQGILMKLERRFPSVRGRLLTYSAILLPLPLLFHAPFREMFIAPLLSFGKSIAGVDVLGFGLWTAAGLHLLILTASFQVPMRLNWKEELPRLSSFNQKLMWTYGLFIVLCILAFSALTFTFHTEFVRNTPVAVGLAAFITVFWLLRVLVDCFYFNHSDWPKGPQFVAGHALLTSLFSFLVLVYGTVVINRFI